MVLRGCMVNLAKSGSSRHKVWIYSDTHSFIFLRVSLSVSAPTRFMASAATSSSLRADILASCACSASLFARCLASHSALRLASAASCSARFLSSDSFSAPEAFVPLSTSSVSSVSLFPGPDSSSPSSYAASGSVSSWTGRETAAGSCLSVSKGTSPARSPLSVNPSENPLSSFSGSSAGNPPSSKGFSSIHTSMFISSNALFISDLLSSKTSWSGENPFHAIAAVRPSSPHFFARKGEKRTGSNVLPSM